MIANMDSEELPGSVVMAKLQENKKRRGVDKCFKTHFL